MTANPAMSAIERPAPPRRQSLRRRISRSVPWIFGISVALVLFVAYRLRHLDLITAESGVGYWFGISGATLMALLLIYPLRKRVKALAIIGGVRFWFNTHMMFGILGPALIILHSNFHLGSTNSNVALVSMLIVAGSGLIGRFIYIRIHHGLSERKTTSPSYGRIWSRAATTRPISSPMRRRSKRSCRAIRPEPWARVRASLRASSSCRGVISTAS